MDKNMTMLGRRSFLAGMGIAGIGTLAACAPKASDNPSVDELADTGAETVSAASGPKEVTAETVRIIPTGEQMSLEELIEELEATTRKIKSSDLLESTGNDLDKHL